jgi:hypothetical protein
VKNWKNYWPAAGMVLVPKDRLPNFRACDKSKLRARSAFYRCALLPNSMQERSIFVSLHLVVSRIRETIGQHCPEWKVCCAYTTREGAS